MGNTAKTVGDNLTRLRKARKLSQEALAGLSKVPRRTIQNIEYGETTSPELDTLRGLSKALDVPLADLLDDGSTAHALAGIAAAADFLSTFANLPTIYQQVILAIAYKDPSRLDGLPESIEKPLLVLLKAR